MNYEDRESDGAENKTMSNFWCVVCQCTLNFNVGSSFTFEAFGRYI